MKGKSTIILTDTTTGKKEVYKNDNMLTHGLEVYLSRVPFYGKEYSNDIKEYLCGIWAFGNVQEEDPYNYIIGADDVLIGHAGYTAYNGVNPYRGQLNTTESDLTGKSGKYRFVWDFGTDKALGTISSLSMCPSKTGEKGLGTTVSYYSPLILSDTFLYIQKSSSYKNQSFIKDENTISVMGDIQTNGEFEIYEYDIPDTNVTFSNFLPTKIKNTVVKNIPEEFLNLYSVSQINTIPNKGDNESITFYGSGSVSSGKSATILIMDKNYDFSIVTFVNNQKTSISMNTTHYDTTQNKLCTTLGIFNLNDGSFLPVGVNLNSMPAGVINKYYYNYPYMVNTVTGEVFSAMMSSSFGCVSKIGKKIILTEDDASKPNTKYVMGGMPLFKHTINNLETPVTKTEAQTMKIIYDLLP